MKSKWDPAKKVVSVKPRRLITIKIIASAGSIFLSLKNADINKNTIKKEKNPIRECIKI